MKIHAAIQGFLMDWELRNHSPNALRLYCSCLCVFARWRDGEGVTEAEDVTVAHVRSFMLHTQQRTADAVNPKKWPRADGSTLSTASLQSCVKAIKVLCRWLVEEEVITRNPALRLQKPSGIDDVRCSPHTFRHKFSTMYLEQGGTLEKLSRELGQSKTSVTEQYIKTLPLSVARQDHEEFSPIRRLKIHSRRLRPDDQAGQEPHPRVVPRVVGKAH